MNIRFPILFVLVVSMSFIVIQPLMTLAQPTISNIRASQRTDGSGLVDIFYDLSGAHAPVLISVSVSPDNGQKWNVYPRRSYLTGEVGAGITNGTNRRIVWNAGADRPGIYWPQTKVRVYAAANDGEVLTVMLPGDVPMELVRIPAGTFLMGSPTADTWAQPSEVPQHQVTLSYDFHMGRTPVTQAQWLAVMGSWPGTAPSEQYGLGPDHPACFINWNDANNYIAALNDLGYGVFRLPSESEWEYACRAGTTTQFSFGDDEHPGSWDDCGLPRTLNNHAWYCNNSGGKTHPVAQFPANPFGLYDMHGNVVEWCLDRWHTNYTGAPTNGSAWVSGTDTSRVSRGGSYNGKPLDLRSAYRGKGTPDLRSGNLGFRVAGVQYPL